MFTCPIRAVFFFGYFYRPWDFLALLIFFLARRAKNGKVICHRPQILKEIYGSTRNGPKCFGLVAMIESGRCHG